MSPWILQISCFNRARNGAWGIHQGTLKTIAFILCGNRLGKLLPPLLFPALTEDDGSNEDEIWWVLHFIITHTTRWMKRNLMTSSGAFKITAFHLPPAWISVFQGSSNVSYCSPSLYSSAVRARDGTCRLTGAPEALEVS